MSSKKILTNLIQAFKAKTKKTIALIALETGLSEENLYKWEKGTNPRDPEEYNLLVAYLKKGLEINPMEPPVELERGDEIGVFHLGSTAVLLTPPGVILSHDLGPIRYGQALSSR